MSFLDHPEKFYPIIGILFVLWVTLTLKKIGERKETGKSYLGSAMHSTTMTETIENLARRIVTTYPQLADKEQAQMVRDELRLRGVLKVDMYEGTIFSTIVRIKSQGIPPPPLPPA